MARTAATNGTAKVTKTATATSKKTKAKATNGTVTTSKVTKAATAKTIKASKKPAPTASKSTKAVSKETTKTPANISRKRKADVNDETDAEEPSTPPAKKIKPLKTITRKPKIPINKVPDQRLDVFVFGEGSSSELGLGTAKNAIDVKRPRLNPLLPSKDVGVVHVACGGMHVAALTHDNKILTWGVNDQGALGRNTDWEGGLKDMDENASDDSDKSDSGLNPLESNPTAIPASSFPEGTTFVKLSAGDSHTLALTDDGLVYGWGCFRVSMTLNVYTTSH